MSGGIFALLDDVAVLARMAAAASTKSAGVVVDDLAVTPQYVHGVTSDRELPIIRKIAIGSIRNKLLLILPAAMLFSQFLPWLLTPLLMVGATYLCYEGGEKIWERVTGHEEHDHLAVEEGPDAETEMVSGAIRTDFILSAEIMVIALNEVADERFVSRAVILIVVAFVITLLVYGVVAMIVKMDDVGLHLSERASAASKRTGRALVAAMPKLLTALSTIGIVAMLWVGGHILLVGVDELGWHAPYDLVHHIEQDVHHAVDGIGAALGWLVNTAASAVVGLTVGALAVGAMHVLPLGHRVGVGDR
jgi:predicted DNA repair protein MutK